MGRHLLLALALFFIGQSPLKAEDGKFTVFPLCAADGNNQSERLDHFHQLLADLGSKMELSSLTMMPQNAQISNCEASMRRSVAALYNIEGFLQGEYLISGDSVTISMQFVNTLFIDRTLDLDKVEGNIHHFNDVIFKLALNALNALSFQTDTLQNLMIHAFIAEDEKKYLTTLSNTTNAQLELGKLAYGLGNYEKTAEALLGIEPGDINYAEAQYILGKCVLMTNDYHQALKYFNKAKKAGFLGLELTDYIYQAERLNKPCEWFDTEKKRKDWWLQLNSEDAVLMIEILNKLNINQKKYRPDYQYQDADIKALFNTEALSLENAKLKDLNVFRHFTRVSFMLLDDCKLETGAGIDYFNHLKIIKSNKENLLKLPGIDEFIHNNGVTTLVN